MAPDDVAHEPIACTLGANDLPKRIAAWQAALARVVSRQPIAGGLRLAFANGAEVGTLAELVVAEQACCAFLGFAITVDGRGVGLEITGPPDAVGLVQELFGTTA